jgi:lysozyme family protein
MEHTAEKYLVGAINAAESGVDYYPKTGATCPFCGEKTRVKDTRPWIGNCRVRYHKCANPACCLKALSKTIKSVEVV